MSGRLYIVPTPVGNLEDMTFRAVEVLKEADLVLAEDTRTTSVLFKHFDIHTPLRSHHKYNEHGTVEMIKEKILSGVNVALVSDAGTPGISDPGFLLARTCAEEGIEVQTLPGATACIPAIVSSALLKVLSEETRTMVFYESPYRLVKTLEQFSEYFGASRRCSVAREISKIHEEHCRGTISDVLQHFKEHEPKGEIVIVVAGAEPKKEKKNYGKKDFDYDRGDSPDLPPDRVPGGPFPA